MSQFFGVKSVTIPAEDNVSDSVFIGIENALVGIVVPEDVDTGTVLLTIQSSQDGITWGDMYIENGATLFQATTAQPSSGEVTWSNLNPADTASAVHIRLVAFESDGTTASDQPTGTPVTIALIIAPLKNA